MASKSSFAAALISLRFLVTAGYWQPLPGASWQWQLDGGEIDTSYDVDVYDVDLFETSQSIIDALHNANRTVICYVNVGAFEDWRSDASDFPDSVKGNALDGWQGENWLDVRQWDVLGPIMESRFDLAVSKQCDGIEPDNMDAYDNDSGFALSADDQIEYNKNIATAVHARGMSVGLKNDVGQLAELEPFFDWALNEECYQYEECDGYSVFLENEKAVFACEYEGNADKFCVDTKINGKQISRIGKNYDLEPCVLFCLNYTGEIPSCLESIGDTDSAGTVRLSFPLYLLALCAFSVLL